MTRPTMIEIDLARIEANRLLDQYRASEGGTQIEQRKAEYDVQCEKVGKMLEEYRKDFGY